MSTIPACPVCSKENTYQDADLYICADCFHEWPVSGNAVSESTDASDGIVRDANGNPLADGDSVILIKDLKVKGSSTVLKKGTKVKSIRLGNAYGGRQFHVEGRVFEKSLVIQSLEPVFWIFFRARYVEIKQPNDNHQQGSYQCWEN